MSIKATTLVWERSQVKGGSLLIMLAIADYAKDSGLGAYPSTSTLARKSRLSERQVFAILKQLQEEGEIVEMIGADDAGRPRRYLHIRCVYDWKAFAAERGLAASAPAKSASEKIAGGVNPPETQGDGAQLADGAAPLQSLQPPPKNHDETLGNFTGFEAPLNSFQGCPSEPAQADGDRAETPLRFSHPSSLEDTEVSDTIHCGRPQSPPEVSCSAYKEDPSLDPLSDPKYRSALDLHPVEPVENPAMRVLIRLAHTELDLVNGVVTDRGAFIDLLKTRCAHAHLAYDTASLERALDAALWQRKDH